MSAGGSKRWNLTLIAFLVADLLVASNFRAWSRMLDSTQGGHGDEEMFVAVLLSALAGIAVGVVGLVRRRPVALVAALAVPIAVFTLSGYIGLAATHLLRPHYCARIESPGQCGRCFDGEEQHRRCGG